MNSDIFLWLLQDGVTNGAIYALLALALLLVFAVTRVIFVPQGEFITFAALSLSFLEAGRTPGTKRISLMVIPGRLTRTGETERLYLRSPGYTARKEYLPFVVGAVHFAENVELDVIVTDFHSLHGLVPRRFWMFTFVQV